MTLVPVNREEINSAFYKQTKNLKLLTKFIEMNAECVRVDFTDEWKNATIARNTLQASIRRYRFANIEAVKHGENVYLVKKDGAENE